MLGNNIFVNPKDSDAESNSVLDDCCDVIEIFWPDRIKMNHTKISEHCRMMHGCKYR